MNTRRVSNGRGFLLWIFFFDVFYFLFASFEVNHMYHSYHVVMNGAQSKLFHLSCHLWCTSCEHYHQEEKCLQIVELLL